jgi:hypothetical protein
VPWNNRKEIANVIASKVLLPKFLVITPTVAYSRLSLLQDCGGHFPLETTGDLHKPEEVTA